MATAGEKFCDTLVEAGIDHVFGLPGGATLTIFDALFDRREEIRSVLVRHEGGAACMADMYGRLTGKPGVVMGQGLWIGTSGAYGVVESYLAGVPMIVICDASDYSSLGQFGPYQGASGDYGSVDLPNIMRGMTKFTAYATSPSEFVHGVQLAVKHATTGRPGPTCVLVKWAASDMSIEEEEIKPKLYPLDGYLKGSPACISRPDAERIANLLLDAERPVMIAGTGVHRATAYYELLELAELIGMPVATTYMGKSAIPETHDLSVGIMGLIGQEIANTTVSEADLILAVGTCLAPDNTKMMSTQFIDPERQKIIQIDIEPLHTGWTYPIEIGVTSDARLALREIIDSIEASAISFDVRKRIEDVKRSKLRSGFFNDDALHSKEIPIAPERLVKELHDVVGADDFVVLDAGNNRMWMAHHFKTKGPGQIIAAGGAAGVGYGLAASLATQMLKPENRVVCICGDGGMMMHLYVLEMANELDLPVSYVVMNNGCLGNVMDYQAENRRIVSQYERANFANIARGFDVAGIRVERPEEIKPALEAALETEAPIVVDVVTADYPHFRMRK
jgi:acetolactate synthase-1/2/3 large subunit